MMNWEAALIFMVLLAWILLGAAVFLLIRAQGLFSRSHEILDVVYMWLENVSRNEETHEQTHA